MKRTIAEIFLAAIAVITIYITISNLVETRSDLHRAGYFIGELRKCANTYRVKAANWDEKDGNQALCLGYVVHANDFDNIGELK
jgi:hypothetical protein